MATAATVRGKGRVRNRDLTRNDVPLEGARIPYCAAPALAPALAPARAHRIFHLEAASPFLPFSLAYVAIFSRISNKGPLIRPAGERARGGSFCNFSLDRLLLKLRGLFIGSTLGATLVAACRTSPLRPFLFGDGDGVPHEAPKPRDACWRRLCACSALSASMPSSWRVPCKSGKSMWKKCHTKGKPDHPDKLVECASGYDSLVSPSSLCRLFCSPNGNALLSFPASALEHVDIICRVVGVSSSCSAKAHLWAKRQDKTAPEETERRGRREAQQAAVLARFFVAHALALWKHAPAPLPCGIDSAAHSLEKPGRLLHIFFFCPCSPVVLVATRAAPGQGPIGPG